MHKMYHFAIALQNNRSAKTTALLPYAEAHSSWMCVIIPHPTTHTVLIWHSAMHSRCVSRNGLFQQFSTHESTRFVRFWCRFFFHMPVEKFAAAVPCSGWRKRRSEKTARTPPVCVVGPMQCVYARNGRRREGKINSQDEQELLRN